MALHLWKSLVINRGVKYAHMKVAKEILNFSRNENEDFK